MRDSDASLKPKQRWDVAVRAWIETGLEAWGHTVIGGRWPTIAILLAFTLALGSQLPKLQIDTSTETLLRKEDPARVVYNEFRQQFGREDAIFIAIRPPEVFDLDFLAKLRSFHRELEERVPYLDEVSSLINARETRGEADTLIVRDLLEDWPETPEDLAGLRRRVLANPLYLNFLISEDARTTTILVRISAYSSLGTESDAFSGFDDEAEEGTASEQAFITGSETEEVVLAIEEVVEEFRGPGFEVHLAGSPLVGFHLLEEMRANITLFSVLSIAVVAALLFALFRRGSAVFLPLAVVSVSIVSTFGIMGALEIPLGVPTQIMPSFLLAVGIGATVHLLVIFYQTFDAGASREDAIAGALAHSGLAIVMTALTTAAGLLSFVVAEITPVAVLGVFAPVGVLLGLIYCLALLPALLAVVPLRRRPARAIRENPDWIERFLLWNGDRCVRHPWTVVVCMTAILLVAIAGIPRLQFSYDPLRSLPETETVRIDSELIDRELRGTLSLEIVVDTGVENGLHEPETLNGLERLRVLSKSFKGEGDLYVGKTVSIADVVKEIHQALNGNRPENYAIPRDRRLIAQELLLFENSGSDDLEELVDSRFQKARFSLKLPYTPVLLFESFIRDTVSVFREVLGENVEITATGVITLMTRALNAFSVSMLRSYVMALMIITPLMFLILGTFRTGAAAMVPNLAPIVLTLGLMGWTGIPLGLFTLMIGGIAIGLAVDDTIHFMHNFRKYHESSGDVHHSVQETLRTTGHAMLVTSVVLSLSFFIFMFADVGDLVIFGFLIGFTIIVAFIADITISPALMALSTQGDRAARRRAGNKRRAMDG